MSYPFYQTIEKLNPHSIWTIRVRIYEKMDTINFTTGVGTGRVQNFILIDEKVL